MEDGRVPREAWQAAIAAAMGMVVCILPTVLVTFSVFLVPVSQEFGWGRATFSGYMALPPFFAVIFSPIVGRIADRFGPRTVMLPGVFLWASAVLLLSFMQPNAIELFLTFSYVGLVGAIIGPVTSSMVVSSWFHRRRGLMLGLAIGAAPALAGAAMVPISHWLIGTVGWRHAYQCLALFVVVAGFPTMYFLLKEPMQRSRDKAAAAAAIAALPGVSGWQALKTANFWIIAMSIMICGTVMSGVRGHLFPLMTDRGHSIALSLLVNSVLIFSGIGGHVVVGYSIDRIQTPKIAVPFFVAALCGLLLLDRGSSDAAVLTGAVIIGAGFAAESALIPYFVSRFFGFRSFGVVFGNFNSFMALSSGFGPWLMGLAFDRFGSYRDALTVAEIALALSILLIAMLGPYVYSLRAGEPATGADAGDVPRALLADEPLESISRS